MHTSVTGFTSGIHLRELSFLWLEITATCNLECVHCYANSGPSQALFGRMQIDDWLEILREARHEGCQQVQFIGGEPTLHPDLPRMISSASSLGYTFIEVFTNCTRISDQLIDTFIEHSVHLATSFYTDDPDVHDSITKRSGSFDRTVAQIQRLTKEGLNIRAGIIEMQKNAGHVDRAKRYLNSLGVREIKVDQQRGVGRSSPPTYSLDPMSELCGECWKGKLCITSAGKIYPCVFARHADVGVVKEGVGNVLRNDALLDFRKTFRNYRLVKERNTKPSINERHLDLQCEPTCSPCGPVHFCVPERTCAPDRRCGPNTQPCSPNTSCRPNMRVDAP